MGQKFKSAETKKTKSQSDNTTQKYPLTPNVLIPNNSINHSTPTTQPQTPLLFNDTQISQPMDEDQHPKVPSNRTFLQSEQCKNFKNVITLDEEGISGICREIDELGLAITELTLNGDE